MVWLGRALSGAVVVISWLALGTGCGHDICNEPLFTQPSIPGGVQVSPPGDTYATVVWAPAPDDVLPDAYYARMEATDWEQGIEAVDVVAARELKVTLSSTLASTLATSKTKQIDLELPDNYGYAECSHPGMQDRYFVDLVLTFASASQLTGAAFSKVTASRGACSVGVGVGADLGRGSGGSGLLVVLGALGAVALRRARRGRSGERPG